MERGWRDEEWQGWAFVPRLEALAWSQPRGGIAQRCTIPRSFFAIRGMTRPWDTSAAFGGGGSGFAGWQREKRTRMGCGTAPSRAMLELWAAGSSCPAARSTQCCSGPDDGNLRLKKQFCFKTVGAPWNVLSPSGLSICKMLLNRDIM